MVIALISINFLEISRLFSFREATKRALAEDRRPLAKLLDCIASFQLALNDALKIRNLRKGFLEIGFDVDQDDHVTLCAEKVMAQCPVYRSLTYDQAQDMLCDLDALTQVCAENGCFLKESD